MMAGGVMSFAAQAGVVLRSYPELWRNLTRIPVLLDKSESGGRGLGGFFAKLCIAVAAVLGSEALLRRALDGVRRRLAGYITDTTEFWPLFGLACLDVLGLAAVWLVSYGFLGLWFRGSDEQARLAAAVVSGVFFWRLYMFVFRIFFRPGLAAARLAKVDDSDGWAIYWWLSLVIASFIALRLVFRILTAIETPPEAISAWQLLTSVIGVGLLLSAAWSLRQPVATWLTHDRGGPRRTRDRPELAGHCGAVLHRFVRRANVWRHYRTPSRFRCAASDPQSHPRAPSV
jgi:hypothetical protein